MGEDREAMMSDDERFDWAERLDAALTAVERLAAITPGAGLVHAEAQELGPGSHEPIVLNGPRATFTPGPVMGAIEAACDLVRALCERGARWAGSDVDTVLKSKPKRPDAGLGKVLRERAAQRAEGTRCHYCGDRAPTPSDDSIAACCDACR